MLQAPRDFTSDHPVCIFHQVQSTLEIAACSDRIFASQFYNSLPGILHEDCHDCYMRRVDQKSLPGGKRQRGPRLKVKIARLHALLRKVRAVPVSSAFGLLAMTCLVACLPLNSALPTETPRSTASQTPTPTPTIVWFPPSATPTLLAFPTYTATPEMSPGIGAKTLSDDFSDASASVWDTATSNQGSASISHNRLTLVAQPKYYVASMRHELIVSDFYAEITARPSLCRGEDNYGMVVRGVGSSFYRFVLACNGQVRAERISGGTRLPIHEPVQSGDAPAAPGEVHIAVWAVGGDMRLFLNGRYQFSVTEGTFPSGGLGVFVRSAGDTLTTVTFSDLKVYDVDYIPPTRTPLPQ
jgi:hypothetical protein